MYLESDRKFTDSTLEDELSFYRNVNNEKYYLRLLNSQHEDFTSIPSMVGATNSAKIYKLIINTVLSFFDAKLKDKSSFSAFYASLDSGLITKRKPILRKTLTQPTYLIQGIVVDFKTKEPLPLVNVGTLYHEVGTVTGETGKFNLRVPESLKGDSLKFSQIGFKSVNLSVSDVLKMSEIVVSLEQSTNELPPVLIPTKKLRKGNVGNNTCSKFISTPFTFGQLGSEMGTKINVKKTPSYVDTFNFNIAHNHLKSKAWFRLNIYNIRNGKPSNNVLYKSILIPVDGAQTGRVSINLKPYGIVLNEDVVLALQWVKNEKEPSEGEAIYMSLGFLTNCTYIKKSSQGSFKKHSNLGVGFNLDIHY